MHRPIHRSWQMLTQSEPHAPADRVALDFAGTFTRGTYEGTAFAGRVAYDPGIDGTERHVSFTMYDEWADPVVTMAIGGQVLTAQGAAVYHRIFDGTDTHYDFVTLYGTGPFDGVEEAAFFELYFGDHDGSTLDGTHLPTAAQLRSMPVRQITFGTIGTDNALSIGTFTLTPAA